MIIAFKKIFTLEEKLKINQKQQKSYFERLKYKKPRARKLRVLIPIAINSFILKKLYSFDSFLFM